MNGAKTPGVRSSGDDQLARRIVSMQAEPRRRPAAAAVLADRLAAALVHHEPGWRLPRLGALAASYLPEHFAAKLGMIPPGPPGEEEVSASSQEPTSVPSPLSFPLPWRSAGAEGPRPGAVQIEMGLPPPSAARTLRMTAG